MKLSTVLAGKHFSFSSVKEVLAKANELKSGDVLAGIAASSDLERIAAKEVLSHLLVRDLRENPVAPYEDDEVTRLNQDSLDEAVYNRIANWSMAELREWLSAAEEDPQLDEELSAVIEADRKELAGTFCRSCGYCMPCTVGIEIRNCARMNMLLRRAPWQQYMTDEWYAKMQKINDCVNCRICVSKCPYGLDQPSLLKAMLKDYNEFYASHKDLL